MLYRVKLIDGTQFVGRRGILELLQEGWKERVYKVRESSLVTIPVGSIIRVRPDKLLYWVELRSGGK